MCNHTHILTYSTPACASLPPKGSRGGDAGGGVTRAAHGSTKSQTCVYPIFRYAILSTCMCGTTHCTLLTAHFSSLRLLPPKGSRGSDVGIDRGCVVRRGRRGTARRTAQKLANMSLSKIRSIYMLYMLYSIHRYIQYVWYTAHARFHPAPLAAQRLPLRRHRSRVNPSRTRRGISNMSLSYLSYIYMLYSMCSHTYAHVSSLRLLLPKASRGGEAESDRCCVVGLDGGVSNTGSTTRAAAVGAGPSPSSSVQAAATAARSAEQRAAQRVAE